jgi:hypothetical protein
MQLIRAAGQRPLLLLLLLQLVAMMARVVLP